jgi:hypothetical protein
MRVSIGLWIFAFLIRFAIYLSVSLIAGSTVAAYQPDWAEEPEITVEEPSYDPACPSILKLYSVDMEQMTITLKINSTRTTSWYKIFISILDTDKNNICRILNVKCIVIDRILSVEFHIILMSIEIKKKHMMDADCYEMANHISKYEMEFEIN